MFFSWHCHMQDGMFVRMLCECHIFLKWSYVTIVYYQWCNLTFSTEKKNKHSAAAVNSLSPSCRCKSDNDFCVCACSAGHAADVWHVADTKCPHPPIRWSRTHPVHLREEKHHHAHWLPWARGGCSSFFFLHKVQYIGSTTPATRVRTKQL